MSILPKTEAEALLQIDKAEKAHADLIEVRLDQLRNADKLRDLARHGKLPKIATNKSSSQKGEFSGSEAERKRMLFEAAKAGFEYVDVELSNPKLKEIINELKTFGVKSIVSSHDFARSPSSAELKSILEEEMKAGADVCKIATTPKHVKENLELFNFLQAASAKAKVVCFGMGEYGGISRLLSPVFGGFFTFASLEQGSETAVGQLSIQEMLSAYRLLGLL